MKINFGVNKLLLTNSLIKTKFRKYPIHDELQNIFTKFIGTHNIIVN